MGAELVQVVGSLLALALLGLGLIYVHFGLAGCRARLWDRELTPAGMVALGALVLANACVVLWAVSTL